MESCYKRLRQSLSSKEDSPPQQVPDVQCYSDRTNNNSVVDSLQNICIKFVAKNIFIVESLFNFPDIMGQKIFKCVQNEGFLKNWKDKSVKILIQLFSSGYQESILSELNLSTFPHLLLEDCMDLVSQFVYLQKLDVSDQQLGDTHQLWKAVGEMRNLTYLILKNNLLSDKGLQHLTLPSRMFKRGPVKLQVLSLACNPDITDCGVRYFMCFADLRHLDISGTKIKVAGLKHIEEKLLLRRQPTDTSEDKLFILKNNRGWAADVISSWITEYQSSHPQLDDNTQSDNESLLSAKKFYSRKNAKYQIARVFREQFSRGPCPPAEPCLRLALYRSENKNVSAVEQDSRPVSLRQHNSKAYQGATNFHKCDNVNELTDWRDYCGTKNQSQNAVIREPNKDSKKCLAVKRKSTNSLTSECSNELDNSDMLSAYQKRNSLWSAMNSDKW